MPARIARLVSYLVLTLSVGAASPPAEAQTVTLQNGTATLSQMIYFGPYGPDQAVDGNFGDNNGWSVGTSDNFGGADPQTAVWETANDLTANSLTFTIHSYHFNPGHLLGRFRFSVTTDHRSNFADGLHTGGDVTANWTVLQNPYAQGPAGMTFTALPDHSVLAGGITAPVGIYTVRYDGPFSDVTGIRLEMLEDPSLPGGGGPGLAPANGNFFLTELQLTASDSPLVPEPGAFVLFLPALGALFIASRVRGKS